MQNAKQNIHIGYQPKSLFQVTRGATITGVCNGIAIYFNIDVRIVRTIFVILAIVTKGAWCVGYLALMVMIPVAKTRSDIERAYGVVLQEE
jgi:phage shock protein PspC (stress-responsive transcriptional regulator)